MTAEPLASPNLDDLQQNDAPTFPLVSVPVAVQGPVHTQELPARTCVPSAYALGVDFQRVLPRNDLKRRGFTVVADAAWHYSHSGNSGSGVPVPANTVVRLTHCDAVYARVPTGTGNLTVFAEYWAD